MPNKPKINILDIIDKQKNNSISSKQFLEAFNKPVKKSKYSNKKVIVDGIKFDSQKEADYYVIANFRLKTGLIKNLELQVKFPYEIQYHAENRIHTQKAFYKADFVETNLDDSKDVIDVKGFKTATYKRKKKIIEKLYCIKIIEK
jgi:hypothetical protein